MSETGCIVIVHLTKDITSGRFIICYILNLSQSWICMHSTHSQFWSMQSCTSAIPKRYAASEPRDVLQNKSINQNNEFNVTYVKIYLCNSISVVSAGWQSSAPSLEENSDDSQVSPEGGPLNLLYAAMRSQSLLDFYNKAFIPLQFRKLQSKPNCLSFVMRNLLCQVNDLRAFRTMIQAACLFAHQPR